MVALYRQLLRLYPAEHREMFGEEMLAVLTEVGSAADDGKIVARTRQLAREAGGLLLGAAREHLRVLIEIQDGLSLATGRFAMRNGFRFPKSTIIFMTLILAGIILAIKRGEEIAASLPHVNPQIGPIQPVHSTLLPPIAIFLALFYVMGFIGWAILFALRRSGVHRLAGVSGDQK